jgi:hypothetical protein
MCCNYSSASIVIIIIIAGFVYSSWKVLEFDFKVFQAQETPGKRLVSWKTPGIFIKYSWNFPDFPTFILSP